MLYSEVYTNRAISPDLAAWVNAMPKVEIHVHLEGATESQAVFEMAQRNGMKLPASTPEAWQQFYAFKDFNHFIEVYQASVACMKTPEDFREMAIRFLQRQAAQNILYSEVFFSAALHYGKLPADEILSALAEGMQAGQRQFGARMTLIPDLSREMVDRPAVHDFVLRFAIQAQALGIGVGLGIGGKEAGFPAEIYREVFAEARRAGLHVVAHGGEADGPESIWGALEHLQAERIGHGIRALEDEALVNRLREMQTPVEVSPQSNYCTRVVAWDQPHPIRAMIDAGLYCTVNSDDPTMFSTDLNNEYLTLAAQGFEPHELWQLNLNGLQASFLSPAEKAALGEKWSEFERTWGTDPAM